MLLSANRQQDPNGRLARWQEALPNGSDSSICSLYSWRLSVCLCCRSFPTPHFTQLLFLFDTPRVASYVHPVVAISALLPYPLLLAGGGGGDGATIATLLFSLPLLLYWFSIRILMLMVAPVEFRLDPVSFAVLVRSVLSPNTHLVRERRTCTLADLNRVRYTRSIGSSIGYRTSLLIDPYSGSHQFIKPTKERESQSHSSTHHYHVTSLLSVQLFRRDTISDLHSMLARWRLFFMWLHRDTKFGQIGGNDGVISITMPIVLRAHTLNKTRFCQ